MPATVELLEHGPWLTLGSPRRAEWVRVTVPLPYAPAAPLRLLHLSDLHIQRAAPPVMEQIYARAAARPYDAVLFTGDFVDDRFDSRPALPAVAEVLERLDSRWGTFCVLGNHDGDLVRAWLGSMGAILVEGRRLRVGEPDQPVDLVGLPGAAREASPAFYDLDRDPAVPTIAMSHYPDAIHRLGRLRPDIVLAGHTHGGQINLPGRVAIFTHDSLPRHMCHGVHETENGLLIVSRGIGHTELPVRLFSPPQVIELVITREER